MGAHKGANGHSLSARGGSAARLVPQCAGQLAAAGDPELLVRLGDLASAERSVLELLA